MASTGLSRLLDALGDPGAAPPSQGELLVDGFLLRSLNPGAIRVITGTLMLEFPIDDVAHIEEISSTADSHTGVALPVRVQLRPSARLLAISSSAIYLPLLDTNKVPFAYATRKSIPPAQPSPKFKAMEQEFRRKHGLE